MPINETLELPEILIDFVDFKVSLLPTFCQPDQTTAEPTPFFNCKYQSKGRGVWGEGHEKYLYFTVKHFLATSNLSTPFPCLFHALSMAISPPTTFLLSPPNPETTSQTGRCFRIWFWNLKNFSPFSIFLVPLTKSWFSTPVQLGSKSKNGQFSKLFGPGP